MKEETKTIIDFDYKLICDYFNLLERQGPGSKEVTQKALSFIEYLPDNAAIADIGCGSGGQTLTLLENTKGHITAIDLFPDFIEKLNGKVRGLNYENRLSTVVASMDQLPFCEGELDLIWAEGSIYNIGFEHGLNEWKKYLKSGGYTAVSEVSWLTDSRPAEIEDFWMSNYPEIDLISNKVNQMQKAGYVPVSHFVLPENCWTDNFYIPQLPAMDAFMEMHADNEIAREFIKCEKIEMDLYYKYKDYYGYVFYIGRKFNNEFK